MLESTKVGTADVVSTETEWNTLTEIEQRLIEAYRRLDEQERQHLRRFTDVLAANPERRPAP